METVIQTYKTLQRAMECSPPSVHFLYGASGVYQTAMLVAAELLRRKDPVVFIDAANATDPFFLAGLFKLSGLEPETLLENGYISRCYTFYQVDMTVTDDIAGVLRQHRSKLLLVFGLLDLIDDEQVAIPDVHDILSRIGETFVSLKNEQCSVLLVSTPLHFQLKEREKYFSAMKGMSDAIYRIDTERSHTSARRGRNGTTNRDRNTADRQRAGTVGKLPPRPPQRTTGAFR